MKITVDPAFRAGIIKQIEEREFSVRTGVHCSDLIYCLNKAALRRVTPKPITDNTLLLFSLGWATQRWLTNKDEDEESIEQDGIIVTRDCVDSLGNPWELKATFTSSERDVTENVPWLRQIMAQCYVSGKDTAHLTRFEIMGNWRSIFGKKEDKGLPENQKPTLTAFKLEFTPDELCRNWEWLVSRRDKFLTALDGAILPKIEAVPSGQEYECTRCDYKRECEGEK